FRSEARQGPFLSGRRRKRRGTAEGALCRRNLPGACRGQLRHHRDVMVGRVGKGALAPCPPLRTPQGMVGTLPPSLVELRRTSRFATLRLAELLFAGRGFDPSHVVPAALEGSRVARRFAVSVGCRSRRRA